MPQKKPRRANRSLAPGVLRYPMTLRSLVVRSTARTQQHLFFWHFVPLFQSPIFLNKWPYKWWGAVNQCPLRRISTRVLSMFSRHWIFMICWPKALGPWSKAPGAHGTLRFLWFFEKLFMVWDLSKSVPKVFRSPGNPLINLCHSTFN